MSKSLAPTPQLLAAGGEAPPGPRRGRDRPRPRVPPPARLHPAQAAARVPPAAAPRPGAGDPRRARRARRPGPGQERHRQRRRRGLPVGALHRLGDLPRRHPRRPGRRGRRDLRHRPHRAAGDAVAADPDLGAASAPRPRLLRARDGGPDHDPDDDRRRPVRSADRERPALRPGRLRHLLRGRRRAADPEPRARPGDARRRHPAGLRHGRLPPPLRRPLRPGARPHRDRQRRLPGEPLGGARVAGVHPRSGDRAPLPPPRPRLPRVARRRSAVGLDLLPLRPVPLQPGRRDRARGRRRR